jgi:hypothetical protein
MTEEDTSLVRILVCVILGTSLIILGAENGILGILMDGLGVLVVIYGFSPEAAKSIVNAVVEIATAPFKH